MRARTLSIRDLLLLTVSMLTLLIALLAVREVNVQWQKLARIASLKEATFLSDRLFDVAEKLSVERDVAFAMLHATDEGTMKSLRLRLGDSRKEADEALGETLRALKQYDFPGLTALYGKIDAQLAVLADLRHQIDQTSFQPSGKLNRALAQRKFSEVTVLIQQIQELRLEFTRHFSNIDPIVTIQMRFKHFLAIIMEYTGRQRALISRLLVENADPTPQEQAQLLEWHGIVDIAWNVAGTLSDQGNLQSAVGRYLSDSQSHYVTLHGMVQNMFYVPAARHGASYPISVGQWFELTADATDSLYALKDAAMKEGRRYVETLEAQARREIITHMLVLLLALGLCGYSFRVITRRVIRPIHAIINALLDAAAGRPVPPLPAASARQDEIGKLARVLSAFQRNMEEITRNNAMLERYTKALERSNQELDDFAYIASHDLKEPLRGLFNHASFLLEDYKEKLDADGVHRLNRLSHLAQRMERLVNDLLYFSRLGRVELAVQETDPNEIVSEIRQMMESFLKERNAFIIVPRPMPRVVCDTPRITEVFRNLITNAVKYNDKPERQVEVGFLESVDGPQGREKNVFYVRDNGVGIEREFYDEIFRIFKRLQRQDDEKETGTGAGLTFVKKIVERHCGRIWLSSELQKGSTFYFNLGRQYA